MTKTIGYSVQVFVKTADATIGSSWETAPVKDTGEYIFKTYFEAEKYAEDKFGKGRQWKVMPVEKPRFPPPAEI